MPLPLVPIADRFGVMSVAGFAARTTMGRVAQPCDLADGQQTNRSLGAKQVIRWGKSGVEIAAAPLSRFRMRRL